MKQIAPDYYRHFACIAGACRHSCCIGWEIDIDAETHERYWRETGELGERMRTHIETDDDTAHFRLDERERCPFLNERGLCDIILQRGEDALCQICRDHPRFRFDFSDRTEMGLGLCCEEAAERIVHREAPVRLITLSDDGGNEPSDAGEIAFLDKRDNLILCAQNRTLTVQRRKEALCAAADISVIPFDFARWAEFCISLEQMDPAWADLLREAMQNPPRNAVADTVWEQLAVYFLYRHMSASLCGDDFSARAAFCILSADMITEIARRCDISVTEAARLYSSEIEYSEDNTQAILDELYFA